MWKTAKIFILVVIAAFIVGLMPTIIDTLSVSVVYSAEGGLAFHPRFLASLNAVIAVLKKYALHLTLLYACAIGFIIFMEGRNPDRTILWLLTLAFVPVIGVVIYMIVGPDLESFRKRRHFKAVPAPPADGVFPNDDRLFIRNLLQSSAGSNITNRNKVTILIDGDETFNAIKAALASAEKFIHLQCFIINDDETGKEISDLLINAASRGAEVKMLYDAIGSWKLTRRYVEKLRKAGIECHSFLPVAFPMFRRRMNYRNHRKIIVVDGKIAFTGGLNVGDEYLGRGRLGHWRDTHAVIEGGAVADLHRIFLSDWCIRGGEDPDLLCRSYIAPEDAGEAPKDVSNLPSTLVQVVSSGVNQAWHSIAMGYFSMITKARRRVWITSPYFIPGAALQQSMITASLSGVDVRLMIPSKKDHFLVFWGSRGNLEVLLRAGVRVFMYEKGFIHAKTLLADSGICSVGTCNMDVRSLEINFEDQLFIYDEALTGEFAERFEADMEDSRELRIETWEKRPMLHKILESFGRLYSAQI